MNFDYIIVGGGSAGCVLANRLSENANARVLLVEAGGSDGSFLIESPLGFAYLVGNPKFDWRFQYGPEAGLGGRQFDCARGKVMGGSSSINAMFYVRGLAADYDRWLEMGCSEWGWRDVEPWFRKIENYTGSDDPARGHDGPVSVVPNPAWHPLSERILEAAEQGGIGRTHDFNAQSAPKGLGRGQLFLRNGKRCGAAAAYLTPIRHRKNLCVISNASVRALSFEGKRASGVEFTHKGRIKHATATREVILSAGSIGSVQILERSGIGNGEMLQRLGIPVVHHLPSVGENLQDHYLVGVTQHVVNATSFNEESRGLRAAKNLLQSLILKSGYFAGSPSQIGGHMLVDTSAGKQPIQFIGMPCSFTRGNGRKPVVLDKKAGVMLCMYPGNPRSRGRVHITSPDVTAAPDIVCNYLVDLLDQEITVSGLRECRKIFRQPCFDSIRGEEVGPGEFIQNDAQLLDYAKAAGRTADHPIGSCRMGANAQEAAIDNRFRVFGVQNLRVVDASIMPAIVSANTHAITTVIAERAAHWICNGR